MPLLKNLTLLSKFLSGSSVFFLIVVFILITIGFEFETIVVTSMAIIIFVIITCLFIRHEIDKPLKDFKIIAEKLLHEESPETGLENENLDFKISKLINISELLKVVLHNKSPNKDIWNIYTSISRINDRLIDELSTAKTFKVDRNEFLGNVAHELRTPIFAIQLSIETLIDGAVSDEKVNIDFLERAMKQAERLKELVDDLISISKIETGMKLSKRYFTLADYINGLVGELRALAENKDIELTFDNKLEEGTQVFGDSERLKQVFVNLIENSIKYTPLHGKVTIRTTETEKEVTIEIIDNGIGIPEKDIPRIFERFYRVDKNRSRDSGGSGLGLSIVKHILEAHSSNIEVTSETNAGSNFRFTLQK